MLKRSFQTPIEFTREDDGQYVKLSGYALNWDTRSEVFPGYGELFREGSYPKNVRTDTRFLIKHQGLPLARVKSESLTIREDAKGLLVEPTLDTRDPESAGLVVKVERGDVDGLSVGFTMRGGKDNKKFNGDGSVTREILQVGRLLEVSAVTFPVHTSSLSVREQMKHELPEDILTYLARDLEAEKREKDLQELEDLRLRAQLLNI